MKDLILDVKKLNIGFRSDGKPIRIVKDVSLQVERGSVLVLVGESGCGKSITVNAMINLAPPGAEVHSEHVLFRSTHHGALEEHRLDKLEPFGKKMRSLRGSEIGMIFQNPMSALSPVYSAGAQVVECIREHKNVSKKEAWDQAVALIKKLGIPDAENRARDYPHQFSGGMKQRIVIAAAIACNPDLIVADEPTTALDVTIQAQIMDLLRSLREERHMTIILITHNMGLAAEMADAVAVMYMGRIVEYGTAQEIFDHPLHPYTSALLRSVPVFGMDQEGELETIPGSTPNPADLGVGCEFASRCPACKAECLAADIREYEFRPGHTVRCCKYSGCREVQ